MLSNKELLKKVEEINQECNGDCKKCKYGVKTKSKLFRHCILDLWENKNLNYNSLEGKEISEACRKACDEFFNSPNKKMIGCEGCDFCVLDKNGFEKDCKLSIIKEC